MSATESPKAGTSARERMIRSAVALFRERGIEGTSFTDVLEHSGAPRGSIYYHFPGGKAQLAEEATRYSGELIAAGLALSLAEKDPHAAVRSFAATWREILDKSEFASGCAVAAATIEGERTPAARDAAATAFERWQTVLAEAFTARGIDPERARGLATTTVAAIEGGILLARAQRSSEPLERVADELAALVASAQLAGTKSRRRSDRDNAARPRPTRGTGDTR